MDNIKSIIRRPTHKQGLETNYDQSLEPRWILNNGKTKIKIRQDERFIQYILQRDRRTIFETILEPCEHLYVTHEYFITEPIGDYTKASIRDCFSLQELQMHQKIMKNEK